MATIRDFDDMDSMSDMDEMDTTPVTILKDPLKIPAHLSGVKAAETLFKYAAEFFKDKTTTTFTEIEHMVNDHLKSDTSTNGRPYVAVSLVSFPIHVRTMTILTHFTR